MAAIRGFSLAQISKIKVQFSTFDSRVASARELFRRVSASKMQESNPKCEVICKVTANRAPPTVDVTFSDGSTLQFESAEIKALDMVAEINKKARTLSS